MKLAKLARRLNRRAPAHGLPRLAMITDHRRLGDPLAVASRLPAGTLVILRDYHLPARAALARQLAALCRRRRLKLLIAGDGRLAARLGADGVHFPAGRAHVARCWRRQRPEWLITVSAHGATDLVTAVRAGADAALLGPVFPTASHPGAPTLGARRFAALAHASPLPVYALGGIDGQTGRRLAGSGAWGLAAIGAWRQPS